MSRNQNRLRGNIDTSTVAHYTRHKRQRKLQKLANSIYLN
jgi:hypothetical protein